LGQNVTGIPWSNLRGMATPAPWSLRIAALLAVLPALVLKAVGGLDHRLLPLPATVVLVLVSAAYVGFWLTGGAGRLAQMLALGAAVSSLTAALVPATPTTMTFQWVYTAVMIGFVLDVKGAVLADLAVVALAATTSITVTAIRGGRLARRGDEIGGGAPGGSRGWTRGHERRPAPA
jgi:hypothetical protein